jgi:hypothetical protein
MRSNKYRHLLWYLISAADSGKYDSLSIEEVSHHAKAGTIPAFLIDRFCADLDLSLFESQDWQILGESWASIDNAVSFRRKFGVEKRGLCLLMAFTLESMQMMEHEKAAA